MRPAACGMHLVIYQVRAQDDSLNGCGRDGDAQLSVLPGPHTPHSNFTLKYTKMSLPAKLIMITHQLKPEIVGPQSLLPAWWHSLRTVCVNYMTFIKKLKVKNIMSQRVKASTEKTKLSQTNMGASQS
jgi:hypothetical protein